MRKTYLVLIVIAVLLALLGLVPLVLSPYYVRLLTLVLIFAIFGMSLDILVGYSGLPSFGHAAFFGSAAYIVGLLNTKLFLGFWVEFTAGLTFAVMLAAVFGLIALRTKGIYFLIITLALAQMVWAVAFKWRSLTGGDDGLPGISSPELGFIPWHISGNIKHFYFTFFFFIIAGVLMYGLVHSPFGYAIQGIRESEPRMQALRYNVWRYKYVAFILSSLFAGLAGILFAYYSGFVSPSELGLKTSAIAFLIVLLGGTKTLFGAVPGAAIVIFVENIASAYTERWLMIMAALYVLVVLFAPQGLLGLMKRQLKRWMWNEAVNGGKAK